MGRECVCGMDRAEGGRQSERGGREDVTRRIVGRMGWRMGQKGGRKGERVMENGGRMEDR